MYVHSSQPFVLLMVDDDEDDCLLVKDAAKEIPLSGVPEIDFRAVHDGFQLLDYLHQGDKPRPTVILLDFNLPGMKGDEVLRRLKSDPDFQSIPVVIYSGIVENTKECSALRASRCIQKPALYVDILDVIQSLVHQFA